MPESRRPRDHSHALWRAALVVVSVGFSLALARADDIRWGARVADSAVWYLKNRPLTNRRDCSGLVEDVLSRAGVDVHGNSRTLWEDAKRDGRLVNKPRPGDLAFFDRTYDANRNGKVDDRLTHVEIAIEPGGTVVMVHRGSGRIQALRMNLGAPATHRLGEQVLNDYLAAPGYGLQNSPRLAGQLFCGFARPPAP